MTSFNAVDAVAHGKNSFSFFKYDVIPKATEYSTFPEPASAKTSSKRFALSLLFKAWNFNSKKEKKTI